MKTFVCVLSIIAILSSCADSSNFRGDQKTPKAANTSPAAKSDGQGSGEKGTESTGSSNAADPNAAGSTTGSAGGSAAVTTDPAVTTPASANGVPKCDTLQKFNFVGIIINSKSYKGSTDGQCNTSCHWQVQPADLKTKVGCSTRDCHVPGTTDDSLCNTCEYYKQVCE